MSFTVHNPPAFAATVRITAGSLAGHYGRVVAAGTGSDVVVRTVDEGDVTIPLTDLEAASLVYVLDVDHAGTSAKGNPSYKVSFMREGNGEVLERRTRQNSNFAYGITSLRPRWSDNVTPAVLLLTRAGTIWDAHEVPFIEGHDPA